LTEVAIGRLQTSGGLPQSWNRSIKRCWTATFLQQILATYVEAGKTAGVAESKSVNEFWPGEIDMMAAGERGLGMIWRKAAFLAVALALAGCMQTGTPEPSSEANMTPRDRKLLANPPYAQVSIPEPYRRHIVKYHRKDAPGTIVVDTDARYLYFVLDNGQAIRYGVTVGEEGLSWAGVARVGRKAEWPSWVPTPDIKRRLDVPNFVGPGPHNPMGARAIYLYEGNKDTLYRIHGTNQPEYIGRAISSGCIRLTNEDIIDLYNRVKPNSTVVVLAPGKGDSPFNPRMAAVGPSVRSY